MTSTNIIDHIGAEGKYEFFVYIGMALLCTDSSQLLISQVSPVRILIFIVLQIVSLPQSDSRMGLEGDPDLAETEASLVSWIWQEISSSYLNIALTVAILYLLYKILLQKEEEQPISVEPPVPPMKKQVNLHGNNGNIHGVKRTRHTIM